MKEKWECKNVAGSWYNVAKEANDPTCSTFLRAALLQNYLMSDLLFLQKRHSVVTDLVNVLQAP